MIVTVRLFRVYFEWVIEVGEDLDLIGGRKKEEWEAVETRGTSHWFSTIPSDLSYSPDMYLYFVLRTCCPISIIPTGPLFWVEIPMLFS